MNVLGSPACYAARCVLTEIDYWGRVGKFDVSIVPRDVAGEWERQKNRTDITEQEKAIKASLNAGSYGTPSPEGGLGTPSSAIVEFDAADFAPGNAFRQIVDQELTDPKIRGHYGLYGATPAEVLLHELVHAMRTIKGMTDHSDMALYNTPDEFAAVLVTNIHTAERNPDGLRESHNGYLPMRPEWKTSQGFLANPFNKYWVDYIFNKDHNFCRNISLTTINSWNPIRDTVRTKAGLPLLSGSI